MFYLFVPKRSNLTRFIFFFTEIPSNRLHKLNLDHDRVKMNWLIDWNNKEVLFYIENAFENDYKWFSLGFSSRGNFEKSDLCFFLKEDNLFNVVLVRPKKGRIAICSLHHGHSLFRQDTYTSDDGQQIHRDKQQDCILIRMDDNSIAFKRKFHTCDSKDLQFHVGQKEERMK
jgi:dopamine beta-monooxygenase